MGFKTLIPLLLVISCFFGATTTSGREMVIKPGQNLQYRLYGEGGGEGSYGDCWNALLELKSCTNEIVLFFVDGETYLGLECCRAIRIITRECWPSMLTSLGFTAQEGDILRGYCDASSTPTSPIAPAEAPVIKVGSGVV
ncbi:hypothetical protein AQUCO_01000699v1 [Aquilegia coerulea]|uniref:Prolamin-like domain-containing protein n=1 Tax=Aquilegia coerulea TaxID=218851 RepID=A0A2G5EBC8_AQUCA|nr:hypothetical protein AQUCO_01000699v1 [Aquilegia coerulea]